MLVHRANEVDLGFFGGEGAGWETAVEKLRLVVIDICHSQGDPYAHFGLLPIDVEVLLCGLRAEQRPEVKGLRTSTEIKGQRLERGWERCDGPLTHRDLYLHLLILL